MKTKASAPAPAKDLYTSPGFRKSRAYAEARAVPWFILSAEHGLVAPDEWLAPYERYLPDTPAWYREAWGSWVVARLRLLAGDLRGRRVEVHASAAYVDAIRELLERQGALVLEPLAGLRQGERSSWYDAEAAAPQTSSSLSAEALAERLRDEALAITPADVRALDPGPLRVPGLYSWWVDNVGANDLSAGLDVPVAAGLIYAGLAGATRWPSGQASSNTLWSRINGMHLGSRHEFSTLRLTLGSILAEAHGWGRIDEAALTGWMEEHLRIVLVPFPDPDSLGQMEHDVLRLLDPPLNLSKVDGTELRARISVLRAAYGVKRRQANP